MAGERDAWSRVSCGERSWARPAGWGQMDGWWTWASVWVAQGRRQLQDRENGTTWWLTGCACDRRKKVSQVIQKESNGDSTEQ